MAALLTAAPLYAQETELNGNVIGTEYSVDYADNSQSTTVNTKDNAFDSDLNTFFASYDRSYTWLGLDLGTKHIITKIEFASRAGYAQRMTLGVFEGANNPDFGDAVPLLIIKSEPEDNKLTSADVNVSRGFRYVRYVGPNDMRCNVAELKFYGREGEGDDTQLYTVTGLPTVNIHTENAQEVTSKDYYLNGIISIVQPDGGDFFSDSLQIKGRGNASWDFPKKPYRLKLYNSTKLLDSPSKGKNWTLVNNYGDKTLIRNCLAFQISRCLEMEYTPWCTLVDVVFNGEYKGTYQLCDKIDIRKGRVDITEMSPTDTKIPEITGGYLIELDGYAYLEKSWFESANYKIPVTIKEPDEDDITPEQKKYITDYFNRMAMSVASPLYTDPSLGYEKYLDKASFLKHLIVGELSCNTDTYFSVYMYKDRNSDKIYTGPVWDFDLAFENDARTHPIEGRNDFLFRTSGSTCAVGILDFANRIINSSADELRDIWSRARYDGGLTNDNFKAHIDSLTELVGESQVLNFMRWPVLDTLVHQNYQALGSYDAEVEVVRKFLDYRFPWMDDKIGFTPASAGGISADGIDIRPAQGGITVEGTSDGCAVTVYNPSGIAVHAAKASHGKISVPLNPGVYIVKADNGRKVLRRKILVE